MSRFLEGCNLVYILALCPLIANPATFGQEHKEHSSSDEKNKAAGEQGESIRSPRHSDEADDRNRETRRSIRAHPYGDQPERKGVRLPRRYVRHGRRYLYDNRNYVYSLPYHDEITPFELERTYRKGVSDGRDKIRFEIQAERGISAYQKAMVTGHRAFNKGEYGLAARQYMLASILNQGDPTARLCATHAEIALGHYNAAAKLLRRALDLQPRLMYLPLDIRNAYGNRQDFQRHLGALRQAIESRKDDADLWLLIGYCHFFSGKASEAAGELAVAAKMAPNDDLILWMADVAKLSAPSGATHPSKRRGEPQRGPQT